MTALTEIKKSLCVSPCKHLQRMRSDAILKCVLNKLKLRSQKSKAHSNDSPFSALSAEVHNVWLGFLQAFIVSSLCGWIFYSTPDKF